MAFADMDKALRDTVNNARMAGHSWSDIGSALEISGQTASERFSPDDDPPAP